MLSCPICQEKLVRTERSYHCVNRHHYDIAKEGYVNLHVVQHKRSKQAGDTPESVQARRRFLSQGHYQPLKDAIIKMLQPLNARRVLDIGCGEGYYTQALTGCAEQVVGIDIAKNAVAAAAKQHRDAGASWVVGTGAVLPIQSASVDLCTSFFSPLPKSEMIRVLVSGGYLLMATPAADHLYSLRKALFGEVVVHTPEKFIASLSPEFRLVDSCEVRAPLVLDAASLGDLIAMTPYAYRAKLENKAQLLELAKQSKVPFETTAAFCLYLFQLK